MPDAIADDQEIAPARDIKVPDLSIEAGTDVLELEWQPRDLLMGGSPDRDGDRR